MGDLSVMLAKLRLNNKSQDGHFKRVKTLGSGAFGSVELCTVQQGKSYAKKGEKVAVKKFLSVSDEEMAKKEAMVLHKLNHRFIVRYLDNFKDAMGQLCIVMEYCDLGTLEEFMSSHVKPFPEFEIWRLVRQFSSALSFLHSQHPPILHNDLKPANILCKTNPAIAVADGQIEIKIADFGVCNVLGETPSAMYYHAHPDGGTICYLAPEVLRGDDRHIKTSADMWSLGAVLTYVANDRKHLFRTERDVFAWRGVKSPMRRNFKYPELHDIVLKLLSVKKNLRPSANDLLEDSNNHRWRQNQN